MRIVKLLLRLLLFSEASRHYSALGFLATGATVGRPRCTPQQWLFFCAPLDELVVTDSIEGTGDSVAAFGSIVTVTYKGFLWTCKTEKKLPFDKSMITFKLGYGKVLEGCDKGIRGMRVGGSRNLKIPSQLGFGVAGFGPMPYSIPPNADLEYDVELISVATGPMAEAAAKMGIGLDPNTVYLK